MKKLGHRPRFFGPDAAALFGIYHEGAGDRIRDTGVLICYPAPQEYSMLHWSVRNLAALLAAAGFPVLRFDYSGTGDSAGSSDNVLLEQWTRDIVTADGELRALSGVRRTSIVGVRLGAAVALRALRSGLAVREFAMWDPVINGREYLDALDSFQRRLVLGRHFPVSNKPERDSLMGYPMSAEHRKQIAGIDLLTELLPRARQVRVFSTDAQDAHARFVARAEQEGLRISHEITGDPRVYTPGIDPAETVFANSAPRSIVRFIAGES